MTTKQRPTAVAVFLERSHARQAVRALKDAFR
jgi:hypothetical protein